MPEPVKRQKVVWWPKFGRYLKSLRARGEWGTKATGKRAIGLGFTALSRNRLRDAEEGLTKDIPKEFLDAVAAYYELAPKEPHARFLKEKYGVDVEIPRMLHGASSERTRRLNTLLEIQSTELMAFLDGDPQPDNDAVRREVFGGRMESTSANTSKQVDRNGGTAVELPLPLSTTLDALSLGGVALGSPDDRGNAARIIGAYLNLGKLSQEVRDAFTDEIAEYSTALAKRAPTAKLGRLLGK